jgi:hypothetical protein
LLPVIWGSNTTASTTTASNSTTTATTTASWQEKEETIIAAAAAIDVNFFFQWGALKTVTKLIAGNSNFFSLQSQRIYQVKWIIQNITIPIE